MKAHHCFFDYGPVVQLVRTPACHAGGRRFETVPGRHFSTRSLFDSICGLPSRLSNASVAQSVEQGTENPCVGGSIPPRGTNHAGVAQLAEQLICNQQVVGSIPITSSTRYSGAALQFHMGRFQSGQMDQTVNLTSTTSVVRIYLFPPRKRRYQKVSPFALREEGTNYRLR